MQGESIELIKPADWNTLVNVSEDGVGVFTDESNNLWVITADDPDGQGDYLYRVWFIPESVETLPSEAVRELPLGIGADYPDAIVAIGMTLKERLESEMSPATS